MEEKATIKGEGAGVNLVDVICSQCKEPAKLDVGSLICPKCQAKTPKENPFKIDRPTHKISAQWPPGIAIMVEGLSVEEVMKMYTSVLSGFRHAESKPPEVKRALDQFIQ